MTQMTTPSGLVSAFVTLLATIGPIETAAIFGRADIDDHFICLQTIEADLSGCLCNGDVSFLRLAIPKPSYRFRPVSAEERPDGLRPSASFSGKLPLVQSSHSTSIA